MGIKPVFNRFKIRVYLCWHAYEKKVVYKVSVLEDEIMALTKFAVKRYSDTKNETK